MTVELAVVFPVLLAVAVIAVNALLFFSECAAFDRVAREAVRVHAASPACGQGLEQSCALVSQTVEQAFDRPYVGTRVRLRARLAAMPASPRRSSSRRRCSAWV